MSIKNPIHCEFDLAKEKQDRVIADIHIDDRNTETLEVSLRQNGEQVDLTGAQITAAFVGADGRVLLSDHVVCTLNAQGNILIPCDNAVVGLLDGYMDIEVTVTDHNDVLTLQFPLTVRVHNSILDGAAVSEQSQGTIPALLAEVRSELARVRGFVDTDDVYDILDNALSGNENLSPALLLDNNNPSGAYILYYIDSVGEVRHELFDFSQHFAAKATTLAGYGITDAYTKAQVDTAIQTAIGGVENGAY